MNDAKDGMVKVGTFEPMGRGDVYVSEELLAQRGVEVVEGGDLCLGADVLPFLCFVHVGSRQH